MPAAERLKILCVDDEPNILAGLALHLERRYDIATATSGADGLKNLEDNPSIAIVISDMRMPEMDGATFLGHVRQLRPDSVRILLTGQTDMNSAIAAINEGQIFRFLTKPCPPDVLLDAVQAAAEQYRLITSERILLEQTLKGCIKTLMDVLALAHPLTFGRVSRIKQSAKALVSAMKLPPSWQLEVATMMSQIGCLNLPASTNEKLYYGRPLSADEQAMTERLPVIAEGLLANIPRLEDVRDIVLHQDRRFNGANGPPDGPRREKIPLGARILKVVIDYDQLEAAGLSPTIALDTMRSRIGWYDPEILAKFSELRGSREKKYEIRELPLSELLVGMVLADDWRASTGVLLAPRGYEVTRHLLERISNSSTDVQKQQVRVITEVLEPEI